MQSLNVNVNGRMLERITRSIKDSIKRIKDANLNTTVILVACCFIDGLGSKFFQGGSEYRFKKYVEVFMRNTFFSLKSRSFLLGKKSDFCLHALWRDVRCGLVHKIDPESKSIILGRGKSIAHQNVYDKRFLDKELVLSSPRFIEDFLHSLDLLNPPYKY